MQVNSVTKKVFSAEKPSYRVKAFLAQDNWFIFEGKLKMKVNKIRICICDNSSASRVAHSCNVRGNTNLKFALPS